MSVSGPKGPGSGAKNPAHLKPLQDSPKIEVQKTKAHSEPSADEFERIAEALAGSDFAPSDRAKQRKRNRDRVHRTRAILARATNQMGDELKKSQREAAQILSVMAAQFFSPAAIERHKKELARLRARIDRAYRLILKNQAAEKEAALGLDLIEESKLDRVEQELERLNQFETQWGKAMAALELICEASEDGHSRRLNIKAAKPQLAQNFASTSNPSTIALDLAAGALQLAQTKIPASETRIQGSELGRSLDGQATLLDLLTPKQES